jgi:cell wall-associated NlpC family hydrolase
MTDRHRARYRRRPVPGRFAGSAVAAGLIAAALHGGHASTASRAAPSRAAAEAMAFARAQLGKPYLWGGTGPDAFDCSGLAQGAYASAGIGIQRTSEEQWASEPHVSTPAPGDLVFFAGADGTPSSPGHVGIVVDPTRHLMIDAYASGWPVEYDTYGLGSSKGGLSAVVGFTDPAGGQ